MLKKATKGYVKGVSVENNSDYNVPQVVVDKAKELNDLLIELDLPICITIDPSAG